ncbi:hypothetical protein ACFYXD_28935 [Streptomyces platensis]
MRVGRGRSNELRAGWLDPLHSSGAVHVTEWLVVDESIGLA